MTDPKLTARPPLDPCPRCEGQGEVWAIPYDNPRECPECEGRGILDQPPRPLTETEFFDWVLTLAPGTPPPSVLPVLNADNTVTLTPVEQLDRPQAITAAQFLLAMLAGFAHA